MYPITPKYYDYYLHIEVVYITVLDFKYLTNICVFKKSIIIKFEIFIESRHALLDVINFTLPNHEFFGKKLAENIHHIFTNYSLIDLLFDQ